MTNEVMFNSAPVNCTFKAAAWQIILFAYCRLNKGSRVCRQVTTYSWETNRKVPSSFLLSLNVYSHVPVHYTEELVNLVIPLVYIYMMTSHNWTIMKCCQILANQRGCAVLSSSMQLLDFFNYTWTCEQRVLQQPGPSLFNVFKLIHFHELWAFPQTFTDTLIKVKDILALSFKNIYYN